MRGEHTFEPAPTSCRLESSPRARGAPGAPALDVARVRIIPACAGSTFLGRCSNRRRGDHPRMRGEHATMPRPGGLSSGSSPHARGAHLGGLACRAFCGIIPACAGSTQSLARGLQGPRDHPRMRGEHYSRLVCLSGRRGSSPHARGALVRLAQGLRRGGIIPACAGSTASLSPAQGCAGDHPRMRGEHKDSSSPSTPSAGSSPHTRGTLHLDVPLHLVGGIIPACAGSTPPWPGLRPPGGDHPRMRGEHSSRGRDPVPRPGSSPHARRARRTRPPCGCWRRIIPACAGSTVCLSATPRCGILKPPEKTWATGPE